MTASSSQTGSSSASESTTSSVTETSEDSSTREKERDMHELLNRRTTVQVSKGVFQKKERKKLTCALRIHIF